MTKFLQFHLLTTYPPSCPNRDDLGRPKTARFGNAERMRISSQSLKRAVRVSPPFASAEGLRDHKANRTQQIGEVIEAHIKEKGADDKQALEISKQIAGIFGKIDDKNKHHGARIRQLAFISPDELNYCKTLAEKIMNGDEDLPKDKKGKLDIGALTKTALRRADGAVDLAMFGRMLADNPDFNREAAVQVSHAITTNTVMIEDDFYTAVDDLKKDSEDAGAGFVGEQGFGSGVFYIYVCVDTALLLENLAGDEALAQKGIEALVQALATSSPDGKKNSFAHGGLAQFILVEAGDQQTRTLAPAFLKPVDDLDLMDKSINCLKTYRDNMDKAYGKRSKADKIMDTLNGGESLEDIKTFCASHIGAS